MINFIIILVVQLLTIYFLHKNRFYILRYCPLIDRAGIEKRKIHKVDTPKLGGLYLAICLIEFYILDTFLMKSFYFEKKIFFFSLSIFFFGLIDDIFNVNANLKFVIILIITFFFVYFDSNIQVKNLIIASLDYKVNFGRYSIPFTILCLLLAFNAYNMIDGINGLFITLSISILIYLLFYASFNYFILFLIINLFVILFLNLKNQLFMGDSGTLMITCIFCYLIINYHNAELSALKTAEEIFLLMILPGVDMLRMFILRIKNNQNPFLADNNHFHHKVYNKTKNNLKSLVLIFFIATFPTIMLKLNINFLFIIFLFFLIYFYILINNE